jgi:hypothetical protein
VQARVRQREKLGLCLLVVVEEQVEVDRPRLLERLVLPSERYSILSIRAIICDGVILSHRNSATMLRKFESLSISTGSVS